MYDAYLFNGRPKGGYLDCIGSRIPTIKEAKKRIEDGAPKIASWWGEAHGQITSRCRIILLFEYKEGEMTWTRVQRKKNGLSQNRG